MAQVPFHGTCAFLALSIVAVVAEEFHELPFKKVRSTVMCEYEFVPIVGMIAELNLQTLFLVSI
jgi:hypothetical protein